MDPVDLQGSLSPYLKEKGGSESGRRRDKSSTGQRDSATVYEDGGRGHELRHAGGP